MTYNSRRPGTRFAATILCATALTCAHSQAQSPDLEVTARVELPRSTASPHSHNTSLPPSVIWLKPLTPGLVIPPTVPPRNGFTLLQKNKMFSPHLIVVPVGTVVMFPNQDPFFHNVFSLFDGKRFDLGLYEAGKTKAVTFSREGVSYIFCNIHSEMSAVVISLSTPLYGIAAPNGVFHLHDVPPGDYEMHIWVEGEQQLVLDRWVRRIHISPATRNLGTIVLDSVPAPLSHTNKFGQPYDREPGPQY